MVVSAPQQPLISIHQQLKTETIVWFLTPEVPVRLRVVCQIIMEVTNVRLMIDNNLETGTELIQSLCVRQAPTRKNEAESTHC